MKLLQNKPLLKDTKAKSNPRPSFAVCPSSYVRGITPELNAGDGLMLKYKSGERQYD